MTHEYKVGDMVRVIVDQYGHESGMNAGTVHEVRDATPLGVYLWSTKYNTDWLLLHDHIEPYAEPTPTRQLSPKEVMRAMDEFATDCGYCVKGVELFEIDNGFIITSRLDHPTHSQ